MKKLIVLTFALFLSACTSTDQVVLEPVDVVTKPCVDVYVPVQPPVLPNKIPAPSVEMEVITPSVMHTKLTEYIIADKTLTVEEKNAYIEFSEVVRDLWLVNGGYVYYAMDEENSKNMAVYFENIKAFLTSNKEVINFYTSKPLYTKAPVAYSLEK